MRIYKIKKLIDGGKVGLTGKYVAVPDVDYDKKITYDNGEPFRVVFLDNGVTKSQDIENFKTAKTYRTFNDRLKRGQYVLGYFEWNQE